MKLKKQLSLLYLLEFFGTFTFTDGVWIIFLLQRGFSLIDIGIAETFFHIVSFVFEIPSGAVADIWGRKKAMMACQACRVLAAVFYICAWNMPALCIAMGLNALSYNMDSGSRDALTFDSLKACGQEERYLSVTSTQRFLCSATLCLAKLSAGIAGKIGYVLANIGDALFNGTAIALISGMQEPQVTEKQRSRPKFSIRTFGSQIVGQMVISFRFLRANPPVAAKMMLDSAIASSATLTIFFLQQHLMGNGVSFAGIGVLLLAVEVGGMVGTKCAPILAKKVPFGYLAAGCAAGAAFSVALTGSGNPILSALGGFLLRFFSLICETATSGEINRRIPSDQRATLISVGSILFSTVMIGATPLISSLCEFLGTGPAFATLGGCLFLLAAILLFFGRKDFFQLELDQKKVE